jgi:hypothetical protein
LGSFNADGLDSSLGRVVGFNDLVSGSLDVFSRLVAGADSIGGGLAGDPGSDFDGFLGVLEGNARLDDSSIEDFDADFC